MRIVVFALTSLALHLLLAGWICRVSSRARARRRTVMLGLAAVASLTIAFRILSHFVDHPAVLVPTALGTLELATLVFGLFFLGIVMAITRLGALVLRPKAEPARAELLGRREALERTLGACALGGTGLALGWGMVRGRHEFALEEVVVRVPGWPRALDGYVIAQVSDIHAGPFVRDRELDEGFELVRRARPDLVVATGDLVDIESEEVRGVARRLLSVPTRDGAFAVVGNHDHYADAVDVAAIAGDLGLRVLCNEAIALRTGDGGGFVLVGVDDERGRSRPNERFSGPDLSRAVAGVHPERPRILLAHRPRYLLESAGRVALQLSGHTHGGQINLGVSPARMVMQFVAGRYERQGTTLWVNRGFGVVGPPSRVGAPPEVTKIVVVSA